MTPANAPYGQTLGITLLQTARDQFGPIFQIDQIKPIASEMGLSDTHLRKLISQMAESGWIEFIKRGTYAIQSPYYEEEIHPFALPAALIQPMAISHWSAAAHHGFTTQIPRMVQASTARKVVTPEMRQGRADRPRGRAVWHALGVEIEFIQLQPKHFFGHDSIWVNRWQRVLVTDPERTALDLIARPDVFGGLRAALDTFELALPQVSIEQLVDYGLVYQVGSVIKRLGWVLDQFEIPANEITRLQDYPVSTYYSLDLQNPPKGRFNSRWQIIENLRIPNA